jgi:hypothetical protein
MCHIVGGENRALSSVLVMENWENQAVCLQISGLSECPAFHHSVEGRRLGKIMYLCSEFSVLPDSKCLQPMTTLKGRALHWTWVCGCVCSDPHLFTARFLTTKTTQRVHIRPFPLHSYLFHPDRCGCPKTPWATIVPLFSSPQSSSVLKDTLGHDCSFFPSPKSSLVSNNRFSLKIATCYTCPRYEEQNDNLFVGC